MPTAFLKSLVELCKAAHFLSFTSVRENLERRIIVLLDDLEINNENVGDVCLAYKEMEPLFGINNVFTKPAFIRFFVKLLIECAETSINGVTEALVQHELPFELIFDVLMEEYKLGTLNVDNPESKFDSLLSFFINQPGKCLQKYIQWVRRVIEDKNINKVEKYNLLRNRYVFLKEKLDSEAFKRHPGALKELGKFISPMVEIQIDLIHNGKEIGKVATKRALEALELSQGYYNSLQTHGAISEKITYLSEFYSSALLGFRNQDNNIAERLDLCAAKLMEVPYPGMEIAFQLSKLAQRFNVNKNIVFLVNNISDWSFKSSSYYFNESLLPSLRASPAYNALFAFYQLRFGNVKEGNYHLQLSAADPADPFVKLMHTLFNFYNAAGPRDWKVIANISESVIENFPLNELALSLRGAAFTEASKSLPDKEECLNVALADLKKALTINPKNSIAKIYYAKAHLLKGNEAKAKKIFYKTIDNISNITNKINFCENSWDLIEKVAESSAEDFKNVKAFLLSVFDAYYSHILDQDELNPFANFALKFKDTELLNRALWFLEKKGESLNFLNLSLLQQIYNQEGVVKDQAKVEALNRKIDSLLFEWAEADFEPSLQFLEDFDPKDSGGI